MRKNEKYEYMYINFTWIFILIGTFFVITLDYIIQYQNQIYLSTQSKIYFLFLVVAMNFFKKYMLKRSLFYNKFIFYFHRLLEPLFILFSVVFLGFGEWVFILLVFFVLTTTLEKGKKVALLLVGHSFICGFVIQIIKLYLYRDMIDGDYRVNTILSMIFIHIILLLFALLCGKIYTDNYENEQQNKKLFSELASRYDQLALAQEEIKNQNEKLKDTNCKVEDTNKKLLESLAELYTVQQIAQAISSIFDIKELLQHVNDIIIGVMGVNNSTILLFDEIRDKLRIHTTNITKREDLISINDNINCELLMEALNSGNSIIENFADPKEYPFVQNRDINSIICIPLITKSKKFGLVLIEHKYANAFDDNNLRLMNIIGKQVGIALENAELYQKMQVMAMVDSLTGIYNRLYFQDRLKSEFENAKNNKYPLSLAIFDIDHFKKFNDTYGHLFGDKVLTHIALLIKNSLRSGDIVARFGGEEFVILFPRTNLKRAYEKVEHLRKKVEKTIIKDELISASVTISFGVSSYPEFANSEADLLKTADNALYTAKENGRNCIRTP
ncbi:UNVERIFIED_CONTAM: diguanylate cyclase (GGDEF)-like protein [Acetivibrio alkalicellulosi]